MKILVFSLPYSKFGWLSVFPQVRGHVLAKYMRQLGEDAEFRALPVEGHFDVAICADYQGDERWLSLLQGRMSGLTARRMFCMVDYGATKHPSAPMVEWFAARGGVLSHLGERSLAAHEHYIGLGVDDVVRFDPTRARRTVLFDFPKSPRLDRSTLFDVGRLDAVRRAHSGYRLLGSGAPDSPIRDAFDAWIPYGTPHDDYVRHFDDCLAFIPGSAESMGLAVAEAQVAGAAIVCPEGWIKPEILIPAAGVHETDLERGIDRAARCDSGRIAAEAAERFSPVAMARRALDAIRAVG